MAWEHQWRNECCSRQLQTHFVDKAMFAVRAGISVDRLDELIGIHAIPCPTYTCDGASIRSAVFVDIPIAEALSGEYFRPEVRALCDRSRQGCARGGACGRAGGTGEEHRAVLQSHCGAKDAVEARVQAYLPFFFNGTFGLCVSDPSTGAGIVRKEMLQEKLVEVTANGNNAFPADCSGDTLLGLIDDYADSSMPFSPAEYHRSSRKRLVDDLRPIVASEGRTHDLAARRLREG